MTDFSKMDGQELCEWLHEKGVFAAAKIDECVLPDGLYNLPACAWAARKWCLDHNLGQPFWSMVSNLVGLQTSSFCYWPNMFNEIDWLRAAAIVVLEKQK